MEVIYTVAISAAIFALAVTLVVIRMGIKFYQKDKTKSTLLGKFRKHIDVQDEILDVYREQYNQNVK